MFRVLKSAGIEFSKLRCRHLLTSSDAKVISSYLDIKEEVYEALKTRNKAIVALESTIITHGMPYPHNLITAIQVEEVVRNQGAIPATIAIINGRIKVGLSKEELENLADKGYSKTVKTSRRDLAYVLAKKWSGGTTVAGTLIIANMVGIKVFATGGIGGVHRDGENTMDISADLIELGKTPMAVVSSGIKSILDIPRTLEYLETQGVCVASYQCNDGSFPAFYTRTSGCTVPYNLESPSEAAQMIYAASELGLNSGFLIGVPIPHEFAMDKNLIDCAIENALNDAKVKSIEGKEVTPFILSAVSQITKGRSLESNIVLIKNNAKVAAEIAIELNKLEKVELRDVEKRCEKITSSKKESSGVDYDENITNVPVVIGGSIIDTCHNVMDDDLKFNGATYKATLNQSAGGVARNIAEAILKIYGNVNIISSVGDDQNGEFIKRLLPKHCAASIFTSGLHPTANCSVIFDKFGDCKLIVGDMSVHSDITPEWVKSNVDIIKRAPLVIIDSNLPIHTISCIFDLCYQFDKSVVYEPTDMTIAHRAFELSHHEVVKFMTPNLFELRKIARHFDYTKSSSHVDKTSADEILKEVNDLANHVIDNVQNIIVTLGDLGVAVMRRGGDAEDVFYVNGNYVEHNHNKRPNLRYYPAPKVENIVNVSGAGDSFMSGFTVAMLKGLPECVCVSVGFEAAKCALHSRNPVADNYFKDDHSCWLQSAVFQSYVTSDPELIK